MEKSLEYAVVTVCEYCNKSIELPEDGALRHFIYCENCQRFIHIGNMKVIRKDDEPK